MGPGPGQGVMHMPLRWLLPALANLVLATALCPQTYPLQATPNVTMDWDAITSWDLLIQSYVQLHRDILAKKAAPRYLIFIRGPCVGLGNYIQGLASALLYAILSRRALVISAGFLHRGLRWRPKELLWHEDDHPDIASIPKECVKMSVLMYPQPPLAQHILCNDYLRLAVPTVYMISTEYWVPLPQLNPHYRALLARAFPDDARNAFRLFSRRFFVLSRADRAHYQDPFAQPAPYVALQLRTGAFTHWRGVALSRNESKAFEQASKACAAGAVSPPKQQDLQPKAAEQQHVDAFVACVRQLLQREFGVPPRASAAEVRARAPALFLATDQAWALAQVRQQLPVRSLNISEPAQIGNVPNAFGDMGGQRRTLADWLVLTGAAAAVQTGTSTYSLTAFGSTAAGAPLMQYNSDERGEARCVAVRRTEPPWKWAAHFFRQKKVLRKLGCHKAVARNAKTDGHMA